MSKVRVTIELDLVSKLDDTQADELATDIERSLDSHPDILDAMVVDWEDVE